MSTLKWTRVFSTPSITAQLLTFVLATSPRYETSSSSKAVMLTTFTSLRRGFSETRPVKQHRAKCRTPEQRKHLAPRAGRFPVVAWSRPHRWHSFVFLSSLWDSGTTAPSMSRAVVTLFKVICWRFITSLCRTRSTAFFNVSSGSICDLSERFLCLILTTIRSLRSSSCSSPKCKWPVILYWWCTRLPFLPRSDLAYWIEPAQKLHFVEPRSALLNKQRLLRKPFFRRHSSSTHSRRPTLGDHSVY